MKLKKSSLPLYYQLEKVLRKRILSGQLKDGDLIPTERELCDEFGVSRITVRQALTKLEDLGLIRREQGKGTFVAPRSYGNMPLGLYGYIEDLFRLGEITSLKLTSRKLVVPDSDIAEEMKLDEKEKVYLFEGFRAMDDDSNCFFQAYIPQSIGRKIKLKDVNTPFLISHVEKAALETARKAIQVTSAKAASKELASKLGIKAGKPLLVIKRIYFAIEEKVLELAITHCPGEVYQSVARLDKISAKAIDEFDLE